MEAPELTAAVTARSVLRILEQIEEHPDTPLEVRLNVLRQLGMVVCEQDQRLSTAFDRLRDLEREVATLRKAAGN